MLGRGSDDFDQSHFSVDRTFNMRVINGFATNLYCDARSDKVFHLLKKWIYFKDSKRKAASS
jgi:hypothetical protein